MAFAEATEIRSDREQRLQRWLSQALGVPSVLATGAAPPVPSENTLSEAWQMRLDKLSGLVREGELQTGLLMRYRAEASDGPRAGSPRLLRIHEGLPPAAPAVLAPADGNALRRLTGQAESCGLSVQRAAGHAGTEGTFCLPVSFDRMRSVEVTSAPDGRVTMGRGTGWQQLEEAAGADRLAVPSALADMFETPAAAAEAGMLQVTRTDRADGITTGYEIILPPAGTRWHDATWLFKDQAKAEQVFRHVCRHHQPLIAELVPDTDLKIGDLAGIDPLRKRPLTGNNYTALRLVFQAPPLSARLAAFAVSWPIEARGGVLWRKGPLMQTSTKSGLLLQQGLADVTVLCETGFAKLDQARRTLGHALLQAVHDTAILPNPKPLISHRVRMVGGKVTLASSVIYLRDFENPLSQWHEIRAAGMAAVQELAPVTETTPEETEQTEEWQAIRGALVGSDGRLKPLTGTEAAPVRQHG